MRNAFSILLAAVVSTTASAEPVALPATGRGQVGDREVMTSPANFKGRHYELLFQPDTDVRAFQLPSQSPLVPRLNLHLQQWLQEELAAYASCPPNPGAHGPDYHSQYDLLYWNAHMLVAQRSYSLDCGGAYPDGGVGGYLVWDLDTDEALDPMGWLQGIDFENGNWTLPPKLMARVLQRYARGRSDPECREAVRTLAGFSIQPDAKGMTFLPSLPHVVRACEDPVALTWRELQPFLNTTGAKIVREKILGKSKP